MTTTTRPAALDSSSLAATAGRTRAPRDGRLLGIGLMAIFSLTWASNALIGGVVGVFGTAAMVLGGGLVFAWIVLARRMRGAGESPAPARRDEAVAVRSRGFAVAVLAEIVGVVAVISTLTRIDTDLVMPAVALVVALHFILIHRAFGGTIHLVMTAVGSVVALAGIAAVLAGVDAALVRAFVGLGMAGITLTYGYLFAGGLAQQVAARR